MNKSLIKEYINNTDIRILTLDGSDIYGKQTMNGSKYVWLSDNAKCQDNYKIGKFYNSQRWERFDAIIYEENNVIESSYVRAMRYQTLTLSIPRDFSENTQSRREH